MKAGWKSRFRRLFALVCAFHSGMAAEAFGDLELRASAVTLVANQGDTCSPTTPRPGLPPGMSLSADGTLGGVPLTPGTYTFTVRCMDSQGRSAKRSLTIKVCPPSTQVATSGVTSTKVVASYRRVLMPSDKPCTLAISTGVSFSDIKESVTMGGAPDWQYYVPRVSLSPDTLYHFQADCDGSSAFIAFRTVPATISVPRVLRISNAPPPDLQIDSMVVDYGTSPALEKTASAPCASLCIVEVSVMSDTVVYTRISYRDRSGRLVSRGAIRPVAVP